MPTALPLTASRDEIRRRTVSAAAWSLGAQVALVGLNFVVVVVLARLLAPEAFGLLAMTAVVTGFAAILFDVGLGAALIQRAEIDNAHTSSVFWLSLAIGGGLTLIVAALAPLIAAFFHEPILIGLTLLLSLDFLVTSLTVVQRALLRRTLRFKPLVVIDLGAVAMSGATAIVLALLGAGPWSLAAWILVASVVRSALLWGTSDWRPTRTWSRSALRELFRFGRNLLGFNIVNYWIRNADNLLVGRFLSAWALGVYTRAYALMLLPLGLITRALGNVMFPAMARMQDDPQRVGRLFIRATRAVSLASFPLMIGLFMVADDFVAALFGPSWTAMIPLVRLFCVAGLLESVGSLNGNLFLSQGRSDLQFRVGTIVGLLSILAMAVGLRWGLAGVAVAYVVYAVLAAWPQMSVAVGLVNLRTLDVARGLAPTFGCAAVMGGLVGAVGVLLPAAWPAAACLGFKAAFGAAVYWILVASLRIRAYEDVLGVLRERRAVG